MSEDNEKMVEKAYAVYNALVDLSATWNKIDHTGCYFADGYPFDESLEEVIAKVEMWIDNLRSPDTNVDVLIRLCRRLAPDELERVFKAFNITK